MLKSLVHTLLLTIFVFFIARASVIQWTNGGHGLAGLDSYSNVEHSSSLKKQSLRIDYDDGEISDILTGDYYDDNEDQDQNEDQQDTQMPASSSEEQDPQLEQQQLGLTDQSQQDDDSSEGVEQTEQFEEQDEEQGEGEDDTGQDQQYVQSISKDQVSNFQNKYGYQFDNNQQKNYRVKLYGQNKRKIQQHNKNKKSTYKRGLTPLMFQKQTQFLTNILMKLPARPPRNGPQRIVPDNFKLDPIDWRKRMTEVGHQLSKCGSCYAFSITSLLQAYYNIKYGQVKKFSQQQLVDCCDEGCYGCRGGWPSSAVQYIATNGLQQYENYPYKAKVQDCKISQQKSYLKIVDEQQPYEQVTGLNALQYSLSEGPVTVIIDGTTWDPLYKSGVFDNCPSNDNFNYNHAVVLSGMNKDKSWIVRNSWGKDWGIEGYIYLPKGNSCGIADRGLVPKMMGEDEETDDQSQQSQTENQSKEQGEWNLIETSQNEEDTAKSNRKSTDSRNNSRQRQNLQKLFRGIANPRRNRRNNGRNNNN